MQHLLTSLVSLNTEGPQSYLHFDRKLQGKNKHKLVNHMQTDKHRINTVVPVQKTTGYAHEFLYSLIVSMSFLPCITSPSCFFNKGPVMKLLWQSLQNSGDHTAHSYHTSWLDLLVVPQNITNLNSMAIQSTQWPNLHKNYTPLMT